MGKRKQQNATQKSREERTHDNAYIVDRFCSKDANFKHFKIAKYFAERNIKRKTQSSKLGEDEGKTNKMLKEKPYGV